MEKKEEEVKEAEKAKDEGRRRRMRRRRSWRSGSSSRQRMRRMSSRKNWQNCREKSKTQEMQLEGFEECSIPAGPDNSIDSQNHLRQHQSLIIYVKSTTTNCQPKKLCSLHGDCKGQASSSTSSTSSISFAAGALESNLFAL